jgi:osmotically-inducible protein OsmY
VLAGIVLGELLGDVSSDRLRRAVGRLRRPESAEAPQDANAVELAVRAALAEHPTTKGLPIDVRALGDGVVELSGTAPSAGARQDAWKVARGIPGADAVVNRILVEGDDVPPRPPAPPGTS